ncbi:DUF3037 domain-containing protein [Rhodopirellula baltica]|uniref:DUF3037 domain-containing protein n=1 Tax=Rhodopirellula baltica SWK14 TaxID=993516 RepID=L7CJJ4_RHOBT|nr:DUF3037 domain-containing protein [Rhodopirellula baltica]ELP33812.1 hypothetical protein RBSWK_01948 [Rhodopirellula baltica SWK14]
MIGFATQNQKTGGSRSSEIAPDLLATTSKAKFFPRENSAMNNPTPATPARGYYSLVQYCPDTSRLEVANIGVVLFCADHDFLQVRMTSNHSRINKMFGRGKRDLARLKVVKDGLESKLESGRRDLQGLEQLERFASLQVNNLQMTKFMPCRITTTPELELQHLFDHLVQTESELQAVSASDDLKCRMDTMFDQPDLRGLVRRNITVSVPILQREQEIPYAYQNGRLNLIAPLQFPKRTSSVEDKAARFAVEGKSLFDSPHPEYGELQMLIVGAFPETKKSDVETAQRILESHQVRLITSDNLGELGDEIREHGHPLEA